MGAAADLAYPGYLQDADAIALGTLRIDEYPTVVVLQDAQEMVRQEGVVDEEIIAATVVALEPVTVAVNSCVSPGARITSSGSIETVISCCS